jgi:hypothetical protein
MWSWIGGVFTWYYDVGVALVPGWAFWTITSSGALLFAAIERKSVNEGSFLEVALKFFLYAVGGWFVSAGVFFLIWSALPIIASVAIVVVMFLGMVAPFYYSTRMLRAIRRWRGRATPEDFLNRLDESAQMVDAQLAELLKQRGFVEVDIQKFTEHLKDAKQLLIVAKNGTAAERIAAELVEKFKDKLSAVEAHFNKLGKIALKIQNGKAEMGNLIALARLCRQSGEPETTKDMRAIVTAQKALETLRHAFEEADIELSLIVAISGMDPQHVTDQLSEGLYRSVELIDSAEQVGTPALLRLRA